MTPGDPTRDGVVVGPGEPCPCGSGSEHGSCCLPLLHQERHADTAQELMRSRYCAYVVRDDDHVFRTWHPRTRPEDVSTSPVLRWRGLRILDVRDGGSGDDAGTVEFAAAWSTPSDQGELHEVSRFARRAGRWFYLDGDQVR